MYEKRFTSCLAASDDQEPRAEKYVFSMGYDADVVRGLRSGLARLHSRLQNVPLVRPALASLDPTVLGVYKRLLEAGCTPKIRYRSAFARCMRARWTHGLIIVFDLGLASFSCHQRRRMRINPADALTRRPTDFCCQERSARFHGCRMMAIWCVSQLALALSVCDRTI